MPQMILTAQQIHSQMTTEFLFFIRSVDKISEAENRQIGWKQWMCFQRTLSVSSLEN
jgi:hypothetical protein